MDYTKWITFPEEWLIENVTISMGPYELNYSHDMEVNNSQEMDWDNVLRYFEDKRKLN
tara:strand:- start:219 stop:392 length:174 start_codon:yes stop_codon:yes gene_type:complete